MIQMIDSHFHLTEACFRSREQSILQESIAVGVQTVIVPSYDINSCMRNVSLKQTFPSIPIATGIHPLFDPGDSLELSEWVCRFETSAIGEIGLDYHKAPFNKDRQAVLFRRQLGWAKTLKKPVIIHCVRAHHDALSILQSVLPIRGVIHRVSASWEEAKCYLKMGFFFGIGPDILSPDREKLRQLVARLPDDRILIETDSPFTHTQDNKMIMPKDLGAVLQKIAFLKNSDAIALAEKIYTNTKSLFGL